MSQNFRSTIAGLERKGSAMRRLALVLCCFFALSAQAQMFRCEGQGRTVYSNQPCAGIGSEIAGTREQAKRDAQQRAVDDAEAARQRAYWAPIRARQRQLDAKLELVNRCANDAPNPTARLALLEICAKFYAGKQPSAPAAAVGLTPAPASASPGAINVRTGQFMPSVAGGIINPSNGQFFPDVGAGYINPRNGAFIPKQ